MNYLSSFSTAIFTLALFFTASSVTEAQLSTTGIGVDPVKKETYSCVRFTNKSQNNIEVSSQSGGSSKNISIKKAKRAIKKSQKKVIRRRKVLAKNLKKIGRQIKKLRSKFLLTPKNQKKLDQLLLRQEKIQISIALIKGELASLKETKKGIAACAKDGISTSGLQIVSGIVTDSGGRAIFFVGAYYPIDNWDSSQKAICVKINGRVQSFTVRHPDSCIRTDPYDTSICLAPARNYFSGRYYVATSGRSGIQDPGTCPSDPAMCSLAEASEEVLSNAKNFHYEVVGTAQTASDCTR